MVTQHRYDFVSGYSSEATIRALAAEASVADNNISTQTEILAATNLLPK